MADYVTTTPAPGREPLRLAAAFEDAASDTRRIALVLGLALDVFAREVPYVRPNGSRNVELDAVEATLRVAEEGLGTLAERIDAIARVHHD